MYIADLPVNAVRARLKAAKLFSARTRPIKHIHETTWKQLSSTGTTVSTGKSSVAWSNLTWAAVTVPRILPTDARVLVTREQPDVYWYVLPLFVLLGLSALFFAFVLLRNLPRPKPGHSSAAGG